MFVAWKMGGDMTQLPTSEQRMPKQKKKEEEAHIMS